jgi:hypothetical protein
MTKSPDDYKALGQELERLALLTAHYDGRGTPSPADFRKAAEWVTMRLALTRPADRARWKPLLAHAKDRKAAEWRMRAQSDRGLLS